MRYNISYLVGITILVTMLLVWIGSVRLNDFTKYQKSIAQESAWSSAQAIGQFIFEKKRLVNLFATENKAIIAEFVKDPDRYQQALSEKTAQYFPDLFAVTVADKQGNPFLPDFDGLVGDLCVNEMKQYIEENKQIPRIHANSVAYHFDIKTAIQVDQKPVIFFVSFHTDTLGGILKNSQITGQQNVLVLPENQQLIEVTADGARINWDRDDYRLSEQELARVMIRVTVPESKWDIIVLHETNLFTQFLNKIIYQSLLILTVLLIMNAFVYHLLKRQEQLRQQTEKVKDEFLSVISHELRTPLTSINGSLGLIGSGSVGAISGHIKRLIDIAIKNSNRLTLLINDILDIQKMETGNLDYDIQQHDINALVQQSILENQGYADRFAVQFKFIPSDEPIVVAVDQQRFSQIMANYLSNAIKYGKAYDTVEVYIATEIDRVRVNVTDHGPGIPVSFRPLVFSKFAQADKSDVRITEGTGLGLSIVKLMAEQQGGRVGFHCAAHQGTTFYVEFPIHQAPHASKSVKIVNEIS